MEHLYDITLEDFKEMGVSTILAKTILKHVAEHVSHNHHLNSYLLEEAITDQQSGR